MHGPRSCNSPAVHLHGPCILGPRHAMTLYRVPCPALESISSFNAWDAVRPGRVDRVQAALEEMCDVQMARKRAEAPRFIAGSLKDDAVLGRLPYQERRGLRGEVLPAKGPARAPWPSLSLQVRCPYSASPVHLLVSLIGQHALQAQA